MRERSLAKSVRAVHSLRTQACPFPPTLDRSERHTEPSPDNWSRAEGVPTMLTTLLLVYWLIGSLIAGSLILAAVLSGRLSREKPEEQIANLNGSLDLGSQETAEPETIEIVSGKSRRRKRESGAAFAD